MSKLICEGQSGFTPTEFLAKSLELGLNKTVESRSARYLRLLNENGVYGAYGYKAGKSAYLQQLGRAVRNGKESLQYQAWIDEAHMIDPEGFVWKIATDSEIRQHLGYKAFNVGTIGQVSFNHSTLANAVKSAMKKV